MDDRSNGSLPHECVRKRRRAARAESGRAAYREQGFGNGDIARSSTT